MSIDSLYLENLEEFVNDENKIVTYKWLSANLKVPANQAKQMLFAFVQEQRNKKENDDISVVYFVAGLSKPVDGIQRHICTVVPEEKLDTFKSTLAVVTSSHIYSVQKSKLKIYSRNDYLFLINLHTLVQETQDAGALYTADYDKQKEELFSMKNYSAIKYSKAKLRSDSELKTIQSSQRQQAPSDSDKKLNGTSTMSNGHSATNTATTAKPQKKGGIAGMFANAAKKNETKKEENKTVVKEEKKDEKPKPAPKKGGVMNFFANHTGKKAPVKSEEKKEEEAPSAVSKAAPPVKKTDKGRGKKSSRRNGSDDEDDNKKKRRRIKDVFDSSSEEEMEYESPVPSPIREPSPPPESPPPQEDEEKEESPVKKSHTTFVEDTPEPGKKRRVRRRKLVPKTFMDDDGYMVTEKVWESESTDASDAEPPAKKEESKPTKQSPQKKKISPPKKKSPPSPHKGKQMALTSFFKKK